MAGEFRDVIRGTPRGLPISISGLSTPLNRFRFVSYNAEGIHCSRTVFYITINAQS